MQLRNPNLPHKYIHIHIQTTRRIAWNDEKHMGEFIA